jgi:hypothetical protein
MGTAIHCSASRNSFHWRTLWKTVGGREHVSIKNIALVEPFVHGDSAPIKSSRDFNARVVLNDNTSILDERTPEQLAGELRFRMIPKDRVAISPDRVAIRFRLKKYARKGDTKPAKNYLTDLFWRRPDGRDWFRSLETDPDAVLAIVDAEPEAAPGARMSPPRPARSRVPRRPEEPASGKK